MAAKKDERSLARRGKPVSGQVEDYDPEPDMDEGPSPEDVERFGDVTVKCPKCRTELFDDVAVCWKCGEVLSGNRDTGVPLWAILVAVGLVSLFLLGYAASVIF
jgi:hypothetical protein